MKERIKFIKELAKSINSSQLDGIEYENENENFKISLKKKRKEKTVVVSQANQVASVSTQQESLNLENQGTPQVKVEVAEEISGTKVMSPMVGTYYSKPSPTSDVFVKEGEKVSEGQTLCIVEAMKLMNEVKAPISGTMKKLFIADGTPIKKGQLLMIIE